MFDNPLVPFAAARAIAETIRVKAERWRAEPELRPLRLPVTAATDAPPDG